VANAAAKLDGERQSIQDFVHTERLDTLDFVQRQRISTLADLHAERLGATADLHKDRLGITADLHKERLGAAADLRGEREAVLNALRDQEAAVMSDIRATSEKEIQALDTKGHDLIDHLFLRAIELMLITLFVYFIVAWVLRRYSARPPDRAERRFDRAA
jgi:hypothetical protein